jgi:hypothetical protein
MHLFRVQGRHHLWLGGVEHNDIGVKNHMFDKLNNDCGVLNDYDLPHLFETPGTEFIGIMVLLSRL